MVNILYKIIDRGNCQDLVLCLLLLFKTKDLYISYTSIHKSIPCYFIVVFVDIGLKTKQQHIVGQRSVLKVSLGGDIHTGLVLQKGLARWTC
jgi:hypothetical protein